LVRQCDVARDLDAFYVTLFSQDGCSRVAGRAPGSSGNTDGSLEMSN
jgi:hypothetical protein